MTQLHDALRLGTGDVSHVLMCYVLLSNVFKVEEFSRRVRIEFTGHELGAFRAIATVNQVYTACVDVSSSGIMPYRHARRERQV